MTRHLRPYDVLVADATPAQCLPPPVMRTACWLLFAALVVLFVGIAHGVRTDLALKLHQPLFVIGVAAAYLFANRWTNRMNVLVHEVSASGQVVPIKRNR